MAHVKFDLARFKRFREKIGGTALNSVYQGWGRKYLTWIKRRYRENAAGGKEWKPLKSVSYQRALGTSLIRTRTGRSRTSGMRARIKSRYVRAQRMVKILIDTGTLFGALSIGQPGNLFQLIKKGIRVGFAGQCLHKGTTLTIKEIAMKHQKGDPAANLPQRKILHVPDNEFRKRMLKDLQAGIREIAKKT